MITTVINGNAIDYALAHPDSILIHVCNNRGVMGAGIALQIKQRIPSAYDKYMNQVVDSLSPDDCLGKVSYSDDFSVCNLTCQDGYGRDKKRYINYGHLVDCVQDLVYFINNTHKDINTVVMPMNMGSALAGGDWQTVIELVTHQLKRTRSRIWSLLTTLRRGTTMWIQGVSPKSHMISVYYEDATVDSDVESAVTDFIENHYPAFLGAALFSSIGFFSRWCSSHNNRTVWSLSLHCTRVGQKL